MKKYLVLILTVALFACSQEKGFKIDKHNILIEEPIKEVGVYTIKVKLHPKVIANLKIWVVSEEG